jgi:hypothetical protein
LLASSSSNFFLKTSKNSIATATAAKKVDECYTTLAIRRAAAENRYILKKLLTAAVSIAVLLWQRQND